MAELVFHHCGFESWRWDKPHRDERDVAVFGRRGDCNVGTTGIHVDRLGAYEDEPIAMWLECLECVKQHASRRDGDRRIGHPCRHFASLACIHRIKASPSSGLRPGPASRSTATCDGAAKRNLSASTVRANTMSSSGSI